MVKKIDNDDDEVTYMINEKNEDLGGCSDAETFECFICMDWKPIQDIFNPTACSDCFCNDCIAMHIDAKVQENSLEIKCPEADCKELIDFERCFGIIPNDVLHRWEEALSRPMISSVVEMYCPYKDCSAGLLPKERDAKNNKVGTSSSNNNNNNVDNNNNNNGGLASDVCPNCKRSICGNCKVIWHEGMDCNEFQRIITDEKEKEAILLKKLASKKSWKRCPKCKIYIQRSEGCNNMLCRCGCSFCYHCGSLHSQCKCRKG